MKIALLIIGFFILGSQAFACFDINDKRICPGDIVFPDDLNYRGATVLEANSQTEKVSVRSNQTGKKHSYGPDRLALSSGCLGNACVGDTVFPIDISHISAKVIGINFHTQKATVRSNLQGSTYRFSKERLDLTKGCIEGICIGDTVTTNANNNRSTVLAINPYTQKISTRSSVTSSIYRYKLNQISVLEENLNYDSSQRYGH